MLTLYHPGRNFLSVSVTDTECELKCQHCQGAFLKHMEPVSKPDDLYRLAIDHSKNNGIGMLISGGCDAEGKVPLTNHYETLARIKEDTDLILNIHTGLIGPNEILALKKIEPDIISIDICGSQKAVKNVYGLDGGPWDFEALMARLEDAELNYVPHVTIGLDRGFDSGEGAALDMISGFDPKMMVLNALMQIPGLQCSSSSHSPGYDHATSVDAEYFYEVLGYAAERLPHNIKLGIGCMRPRNLEIPFGLVSSGRLEALAMPSGKFRKKLDDEGVEYDERDGCCAITSLD